MPTPYPGPTGRVSYCLSLDLTSQFSDCFFKACAMVIAEIGRAGVDKVLSLMAKSKL